MTAEERRLHDLVTDVDVRLTDLVALVMLCGNHGPLGAVLDDDEWRPALFGFLRSAYATGYQHALNEVAEGRGGELNRRHGYILPT